jgi:hypothetical protein
MIYKIIALFLIAMAVLAMFGKLRFPGKGRKSARKGRDETARKCPHCGTYMIGKGRCDCDKDRGGPGANGG